MPSRLRPTGPIAPNAILVGDPGRALLLAQELLEQPKMSNHARGLWGYSGRTASGAELTIQATGMGGPSAALVLADLVKLGVERAVRVGTCTALDGRAELGELLLVGTAIAVGASATSFGLARGDRVQPSAGLFHRLEIALGDEARSVAVASLDTLPAEEDAAAAVADMQTAAVLARGRELDVSVAALLIVSEAGGERLAEERLEAVAGLGGRVAASALLI